MSVEPKIPEGWSDSERWAWGEILSGRIADFHRRYEEELDPKKADGWNDEKKDRRLSQAFLVKILAEDSFRCVTPFKGVRISGACFKEEVDLQHARLERQLWLEHSRFHCTLSLMNLDVDGWLSLEGSCIDGTLNLNGSVLNSHVSLSKVKIMNEVVLTGAKIGSSLDMSGSTFEGNLKINGTEVGQHLFMHEKASFKEVNLTGAKIGGQLDMNGSTFEGNLKINGTEVGQHLIMREKASFKEVDLTGAKIGGYLDMSGSTFEGKLNMNGIEVGESLFARSTIFPTDEEVILYFAKIGSNLDLSGAAIGAIDLTATTITGDLCLGSARIHKPTKWVKASRMILRNTIVGAIQDAEVRMDSWPKNLELEGFIYRRLGGFGAEGAADIATRDTKWFLDWLDRDKTFSPSPYEQLANMLNKLGYPSKANSIRYEARKRWRRTALERGEGKLRGWPRWIGLTLLQYTIGYGLGARYFRVLWWFGGITLIGFLVLLASIEKSNWNLFKMAWASFDQVLPFVKLNEGYEKFIMGNCSNWTIAYFHIQKLFGYVLGGFLGAGLAGLTQKS